MKVNKAYLGQLQTQADSRQALDQKKGVSKNERPADDKRPFAEILREYLTK